MARHRLARAFGSWAMRQRGRAGRMCSGSSARPTCSRKSVAKHRLKRASARRTKRGFWPSVRSRAGSWGRMAGAGRDRGEERAFRVGEGAAGKRARVRRAEELQLHAQRRDPPGERGCATGPPPPPGAEPWTLAGAALVDKAEEQVDLAWHQAPIPASGAGAVVVGIEGKPAQLGCPCKLKRWEAGGPRAPSPLRTSPSRWAKPGRRDAGAVRVPQGAPPAGKGVEREGTGWDGAG